ncbi:hypothetical protein [Streptomyces noursei]|uniref:hypothetical protein n=1 Tax=Streptomyces noursei TaxID=1971 RepID=UPI0030F0BACB
MPYSCCAPRSPLESITIHDGELAPALGTLVASVAALVRLGYPCDSAHLLPYGRIATEPAVVDLDVVEEQPTAAGQIEAAVALTVRYEPVLLSLRRLAHVQEAARRFRSTLGSVRRIMWMPGAWSRSVGGPASTRQAGQASIAW